MQFPERAQQIIQELYERNRGLAEGSDNDRRALTRMMAEQIRFELGPGWGTKASSPANPPSKDAIAYQNPYGVLTAWDWQHGETRAPHIPPIFHDATGQHFIEVRASNHLGVVTVDGQGDPIVRPQPDDEPDPLVVLSEALDTFYDGVKGLAEAVRDQTRELAELRKEGLRLRL